MRDFKKTFFEVGERKTIKLSININDLKWYNTNSKRWELEDIEYEIYVGSSSNEKDLLSKEITKKLQGYKQQDSKHNIYSKYHFITKESTIQRLVESKLSCFYCNTNLMLFYKECKQSNQWTLDRIDNSMGHNSNNVVISCLECNLKRRNTDLKKFLYTKQLSIKKIDL